jgi:hypothetical protein
VANARAGNIASGQLQDKSQAILDRLIRTPNIADKIDRRLGIPNPYRPTGRVKLIFLGQDPTVKRAASRQSITLSLNLDKPGALSAYLGKISNLVGLSLPRNIYATNLLKNFFVDPPATYSPEYLSKLADYWLPLLKEELSEFPGTGNNPGRTTS